MTDPEILTRLDRIIELLEAMQPQPVNHNTINDMLGDTSIIDRVNREVERVGDYRDYLYCAMQQGIPPDERLGHRHYDNLRRRYARLVAGAKSGDDEEIAKLGEMLLVDYR